MPDFTIEPPIIDIGTQITLIDNYDGQLHIYLSYDYLPSRNFYLLTKNVNELYEYIFKIIHRRPINKDELLIIEELRTGNSINILLEFAEKINPPKWAKISITIVVGLIYGYAKYYEIEGVKATTKQTQAATEQIQAATGKIRAETAHIEAETTLKILQIEKQEEENEEIRLRNKRNALENELMTRKIDKEYRDVILQPDSLKKIYRKLNSIEKQVANKPINVVKINGSTIYDSDDLGISP